MTTLPGDKTSDKQVTLTDGVVTVGMDAVGSGRDPNALTITRNPVERNPLKTTAGSQTYSDFDFPYTVIAQDNWSSGRGKNKFEADTSGYMDSLGLALDRANKAFLTGRESYSSGLRSSNSYLPGAMTYAPLVPGTVLGYSNIFTGGFTVAKVFLWLRKVGSPGTLTVDIRSTNQQVIYATATITAAQISDSKLAELVGVDISTASGVRVCVYCAGTDNTANHWEVGVLGANASGNTNYTLDAITNATHWFGASIDLYYHIIDGSLLTDGKFVEYKGALYWFTKTNTISGQIWINGDRGAADAPGAANYLDDATKSWTVNQWAGCIVQITGGVGVDEQTNWRTIVSNTATRLVVDSNWAVTHTTATEYVILGSNQWTEITGHGLTKPITDVVVSNKGVIYVAQGNAANIRRMRFYNNAGTWTAEYADDGTNKAAFLELVHASTGWEVWKGDNVDASSDVSVAKASAVAWGTNLTFGSSLALGMQTELITRLIAYVDANQAETLWILTEGAPWYIQSGVPVRVPLREYRTVKNAKNGRAAAVANVNIYFSLGIGLERYYNGTLDDLGPNLGEGLPANRSGRISALVAYPGRVFAAVDAGASGYSSVLTYNSSGWCEVYRAPYGQRLFDLYFQPVPGTNVDRLWVRQGGDVLYIPFPSETFDPLQDANYPYRNEGCVEMSWQSAGLLDAWKYFRQIKLFIEQGSPAAQWIEAQYKIDDDASWTNITGAFTATVEEALIGSGVNGKRFKMRLILYSTDLYKTPILKAAILEAVTVTATKWSYQFTALFDSMTDVQQLDTWAGTAKPLLMRCVIPLIDNKEVFLMALPVTMDAVDVRTTGSTSLEYRYRANIIMQEA